VIAGHFGLAAAVKAKERETPLWALMLATQWLDVVFVPLFVLGVEWIEAVPGAPAYGGGVIYADYTHSLLGAAVLAAVFGVTGLRRTDPPFRGGTRCVTARDAMRAIAAICAAPGPGLLVSAIKTRS